MTHVIVYKDKEGTICGFSVKGHAGFANKGKDIVCAAVSVLTINTINSIEQFTEDGFSGSQNEKDGAIEFMFSDKPSEAALLLVKSFELGIKGIADDYGHRFLKFEIREV